MKKQLIPCLLALVLLFLSACGGAPDPVLPKDGEAPAKEVELPAQSPDGGAASSDTVEVPDREEGPKDGEAPEAPPDTEEGVPEEPLDREGVFLRFASAMTALEEQVRLDVSGMTWQFGPENDLKNIYYAVLKEYPELKYTYDLEASVSGDTAECTFWYMPYKTGAYDGGLPAGSHTVGSLHDARVMAQSMNGGTESLDVAITDPTLEVDDIQAALSQAGYGWIKYTLSQLGMAGEKGSQDITGLCLLLLERGQTASQVGVSTLCAQLSDAPKTLEQRARRAVERGLSHIASLGLEDYNTEFFVRYSARLFSFQEVRAEMDHLRGKGSGGKVNLKKFLDGLMILAEEE